MKNGSLKQISTPQEGEEAMKEIRELFDKGLKIDSVSREEMAKLDDMIHRIKRQRSSDLNAIKKAMILKVEALKAYVDHHGDELEQSGRTFMFPHGSSLNTRMRAFITISESDKLLRMLVKMGKKNFYRTKHSLNRQYMHAHPRAALKFAGVHFNLREFTYVKPSGMERAFSDPLRLIGEISKRRERARKKTK
jgi:phage host-nuclease inhibitor protein Gam